MTGVAIKKEIDKYRQKLLFEKRNGETENEQIQEGFWLAGVLYGLKLIRSECNSAERAYRRKRRSL